jgi:hypothetical protein
MFMIAVGLWTENRWLASMAAIAVLPLEIAWNIEFFLRLISGVRLAGLADYMFNPAWPLYLRAVSIFHVYLPPLTLWMLHRQGYEPRALIAQTLIAWIILPLSYWISTPEQNINWVCGFGKRQQWMPPLAYVGLMMVAMPVLVYLPTHLVLQRLFGPR